MPSVRNSLLAISGLGTALIIWLISSFWYDAYLQWTDSSHILRTTRVEDDLIQAAHALAAERGLAHAAMSAPHPASALARFCHQRLDDA